METTASFGYWVRRRRKALDLTQQALAEQVGCSVAAIKKIEADERRPSRQIAELLADILGVPASQRAIFLECARGLRPVDHLPLAGEPAVPMPAPLKTPKSLPHNLPVQLTSFIGREHERSQLKQLLPTTHLLTLTGPGGIGKTRLALQLAAEVLETFADGVWLVELAPLADPTLIAQTMAATLGIRDQPGRTLLDVLTDYVRAKTMLLILDNCEHLIGSCAHVADTLLRAAPGLKILASSRESFGIAGETCYRVPSLALPDSRQLSNLDALAQNDCVHLFVDRALAAFPHFGLKEKNAPAIADICLRLDGIPLAIELAAARTKVFPPEQIAALLDDRFRLLTDGSRTALERHQTLRALIDWSYDLLSDEERKLYRQLSVFAGGWSFQAAQAVCGEGIGTEVLELLTHLVDKSLVVFDEQAEEGRYRLPETIRQYAHDQLLETGEAEPVRNRHLDFFLRFAEEVEPKLRGAEQLAWLDRLETEHDNLWTALDWSLQSGKSDRALQLAGALSYFWTLREYFSEGQKWLEDALALAEREQSEKVSAGKYTPTQVEKAHRAKALYALGMPYLAIMNVKKARTMVEESLRLWRELGDTWWVSVALQLVGLMTVIDGDIQAAARHEEGVSLAREIEDPWPLAGNLIRLGHDLKMNATGVAAARRSLEEGVAVARRVGDKMLLSEGLRELGSVYQALGNLTAAASLIEEAMVEARAIGSILSVGLALSELVGISCLQNDPAKAKGYCLELWAFSKEMASPFTSVFTLIAFGLTACFGGEPGKGARLLAATDMLLRQRSMMLPGVEGGPFVKVYKQALERAQMQLAPVTFETAWAEGQQMTLEQALALATEFESEERT
jgi:predicted ATPase/transcriptional regulator with XRE-family HTH domain